MKSALFTDISRDQQKKKCISRHRQSVQVVRIMLPIVCLRVIVLIEKLQNVLVMVNVKIITLEQGTLLIHI